MDEIIEIAKSAMVIFIVLVIIFAILSVVVKVLTAMELTAERRAYDLIAEQAEQELMNVKNREAREKELHKRQLELIHKQEIQAETETRKLERESLRSTVQTQQSPVFKRTQK